MSDRIQYSNPQMERTFDDWPYRQVQTTCVFEVTHRNNRERCQRRTQEPMSKRWNNPKLTTYGLKCRIMDGDDGKIYVVTWNNYGFFNVMRSCLKLQQESVSLGDPRFEDMRKQFGLNA